MSDQIVIKVPCTSYGLGAFQAFSEEGVETFCTTVFSLTQAAAVAQAGANHVLPFCEPVKQLQDDPVRLVRECRKMFEGWEQRPCITAALVRSVDVAYAALRAGADGIIIFWTTLKEMMEHPLTDQWNQTFLDEWNTMHADGKLHGVPVVD
jgi:transaldolase